MGLWSFAVTSLLFTKLVIPPVRSPRIARPHLVARLRETRPVSVVIAPAGYGKTTLLTEWIDTAHPSVAWLSLDEGDNDPVRFWSYVVAALDARQAGLGETARLLLAAPQPLSYAAVVSALCNDILALPQALTLVLDDYHVIDEPAIHAAVAYLIDHQPPNLRLVIGSRVDPPLPLPRLRARDQLREVRVESLRFTPEEARAFLRDVMRSWPGRKGGRPGCNWSRCHCRAGPTRPRRSRPSAATIRTWLTIWSTKYWPACRPTCRRP
jgi:LuxR family maltose regulon positive regulatory protein